MAEKPHNTIDWQFLTEEELDYETKIRRLPSVETREEKIKQILEYRPTLARPSVIRNLYEPICELEHCYRNITDIIEKWNNPGLINKKIYNKFTVDN
jgi:hypothetical protein